MTDLRTAGVAETARLVAGGEVSAREVVEQALARIQARDAELNAFSVVLADEARAEADARDAAPAGRLGPLHGVPVAIKEEIDVAGCVTTFGGEANSTPAAADGEVVRRLRDAGAVVIGKTTMPEFGQFPFTESVDARDHPQPVGPARTPGGSSGGTAVAVADRHGAGRHRRRRRRLDPDPAAPAAGCSASSRSAAGSRPRRSRTCGGRSAPPGRSPAPCSTPRWSTT